MAFIFARWRKGLHSLASLRLLGGFAKWTGNIKLQVSPVSDVQTSRGRVAKHVANLAGLEQSQSCVDGLHESERGRQGERGEPRNELQQV